MTARQKNRRSAKYSARKRVFSTLIIILALVAAGIFVWRFNLDSVKVNHLNLSDARIKDEITLIQITDLHGKSFGQDNNRLVEKIRSQSADAILVTGDLYFGYDSEGKDVAVILMQTLAEDQTPVYYVTGEHDNDDEFHDLLSSFGVQVLAFDQEILQIGTTDIELYGINSVYFWESYNLANEVSADPDNFSILMAHIPNLPKYKDAGYDLILSGDTHGGQVRLPFLGAVWMDGVWFPEMGGSEVYVKGLYSKEGKHLFISSGLGTVSPHIRFWNRPEIVVITLSPPQP
jgi:predicted MPP superfamily phosphohydrolase